MRVLKIGLVGLVAAVLSFVVVGCGGANGGQEAKDAFVGSWNLVAMEGEAGASAEDIALMQSLGLSVGIQLHEDGTGSLDLFGEKMDGTWTAENATQGKLVLSDQEIAMTLGSDGNLSLQQNNDTMIFQKGAAPSAASSSSSASAAAASSAPAQQAASSQPATQEAASSAPATQEAASSQAA